MEIILDIVIFLLIFVIPMIICAVPGLIVSAIIIFLIRKKIIKKYRKFNDVIYVIVITSSLFISMNLGRSFILYASAKPDKVYREMKEIDDNQTIIGLSKRQVILLLGKPRYGNNDINSNIYIYSAGTITNYFFFGERDFYELRIVFDENDKVKHTSIKMLD